MRIEDYLPSKLLYFAQSYSPMSYDTYDILFCEVLELFIHVHSGYTSVSYINTDSHNKDYGSILIYNGEGDMKSVINDSIENFNKRIGNIKEFSDTRIKRNLILKDLI